VVRTCLVAGEPLRLKVIVLGAEPRGGTVFWRALGAGEVAKVPLEHVARGVYAATLPAEATGGDFEYYVEAAIDEGKTLRFPATAPQLNQSVVVVGP